MTEDRGDDDDYGPEPTSASTSHEMVHPFIEPEDTNLDILDWIASFFFVKDATSEVNKYLSLNTEHTTFLTLN